MLDTHIRGYHMNGQGMTWQLRGPGDNRRFGRQYYCYLNATEGKKLMEVAERRNVRPGQIVKELVMLGLGEQIEVVMPPLPPGSILRLKQAEQKMRNYYERVRRHTLEVYPADKPYWLGLCDGLKKTIEELENA